MFQRKATIASNKRRLNNWDYTQPRIYMLTLAARLCEENSHHGK